MIVDIYIENEKLELFKDENISVTSSVLDIQDISKNTTDYTNAFTVPASEVNNKIFKHYYNANIDNTFDARVSVDGRIEIGGMPFRVGKILLQKVQVKSGVASSYMINFWGDLVSLKDLLGDDKLSDLDLSAYDHPYDSTTVHTLLTAPGSYQSIIYTLLAKKQYYYNSDPTDEMMSDRLANIHYKAGTLNGVTWDDLRPSIALYQLINAIQDDYGIQFSLDFFGRDEFKKLYMWLNNTVEGSPGGDSQTINWDSGDTDNINLFTNEGSFLVENPSGSGNNYRWELFLFITPSAGYEDIEYTITFYADGDVLSEVNKVGGGLLVTQKYGLDVSMAPANPYTFTVYWEISSAQEFKYSAHIRQSDYTGGVKQNTYDTYASENTISSEVVVADNIPDLKIIDFLKGLFNAFKLVVIPQDDGTIYVNTVSSYYANGQLLDITNYIDNEKVDVTRGNILNEISYKFQDPQTILNEQFLENTGKAYGDEDAEIRDDSGKLLEGESLDIELPFEQVVYERLNDTNGVDDIDLMYGAIINTDLNPVNPKPHIFYNQRYAVGGDGVGFVNDDGSKLSIQGEMNTSCHVIDDALPTHSFIFSAEFANFNGALLVNNLYTNYHQEYIDSLFNPKRRNYRFHVKSLPVPILLDLTLNDILRIGYNYYRIDKFTTDLVTGKTELNLFNTFNYDIRAFYSDDTYILLSSDAQSYNAYVDNLTTYTSNKVDRGYGTGWLTVSDSGSFIVFTVTENTPEYRDIQVDITDDVSGETISFYIGQYEYNHTAILDFSDPYNAVYNSMILTAKL